MPNHLPTGVADDLIYGVSGRIWFCESVCFGEWFI